MKLLTNSLAFLMAFGFFGCFEEKINVGGNFINQTTLGAYPKLVEVETDFFDFTDLDNASYSHSVDFVDGGGGMAIAEYRIYLSYEPLGQPDTVVTLFQTVQSREFITRPETGQLGYDLVISFSDVATFLGVDDLSEFSSEDEFSFRTEIVRNDGRVFSSMNSTPFITNGFEGIWDFEVKPTCPLPDDMFVGEYRITYGYAYDPDGPLGNQGRPLGNTLNRSIFLSPTNRPLARRLNYGIYLPGFAFFTDDVHLDFSCGNLLQSDLRTSSFGCAAERFGAIQNGVATYDPNDDSTFTIELIDLPPELDGDCFGAGFGTQLRYSIVFTKI